MAISPGIGALTGLVTPPFRGGGAPLGYVNSLVNKTKTSRWILCHANADKTLLLFLDQGVFTIKFWCRQISVLIKYVEVVFCGLHQR
ncbi:hypothetical protein [Burkholderia orbicola]|uniref:hypothetical protein n=1 Tax=Burkholderia orbicola TaxID=2978683 RepID=UPI002655574C|nr:hypothetical protein [Burkholderia orbicola]MDN7535615.1 hypothetical protein [Burkholderia orbicola]